MSITLPTRAQEVSPLVPAMGKFTRHQSPRYNKIIENPYSNIYYYIKILKIFTDQC